MVKGLTLNPSWPIQYIVLFLGFCARINTLLCAPTLCVGLTRGFTHVLPQTRFLGVAGKATSQQGGARAKWTEQATDGPRLTRLSNGMDIDVRLLRFDTAVGSMPPECSLVGRCGFCIDIYTHIDIDRYRYI